MASLIAFDIFFCGLGSCWSVNLGICPEHLRNAADYYKDGYGLREDDGRYERGAKTRCFGDNLTTLFGEGPHQRR
jgi:hypothetical protein